MALSSGSKLGVYEIVEPIGKGGMGEVFRARDTKLGRDVAIKVLPEELSGDRERLARFEREAKLLASLNHSGIATLYGFEESDGVHYLTMELVPGATLAERIASGPIPLEEAVAIARQIADALEAAHEAGVIHRDLKPANIKVTEDGQVKVLDFGLAKAFGDDATPVDNSLSPTLTREGTMAGVILGTAAYMSPEQARGKTVDKRTDIFAFGSVLYEMLTGRRAFDGETVSDILASVIKTEPDWKPLPSQTQTFLKRCLQKDVRNRYRDIGDVRLDLDSVSTEQHEKHTAQRSPWRVVAAALVAFALGIAVTMTQLSTPTSLPVIRSQLLPPEGEEFRGTTVELSPDGEWMTFADSRAAERRRLWVRRLDEPDARPLSGTEGVDFPFWSPDSRSIGFFAQDELKVVNASGGAPRTVSAAANGRGGTWNEDGVILFGSDPGGILYRVNSTGGDGVAVTTLGEEGAHRHPYFLPDGRHFLYFTNAPRRISIGDMTTGDTRELIRDAFDGKYVAPGWITYTTSASEALFAQRFDVGELALLGEPISVVADLQTNGPWGGHYTVSRTNLLAYKPRVGATSMVWVDRLGNTIEVGPDPADAPGWTYRMSPSGRQLAMGGRGLGVYDLDRAIFQRLPTKAGIRGQLYPTWSPDESQIAYRTDYEIRIVAVDGSSDESLIEWSEGNFNHLDWSPNGENILFAGSVPRDDAHLQLWLVGVEDGAFEVWLDGDANFTEGRFSPHGNWIAYRSDETGVSEVYVRPFKGPGGPERISTAGGGTPEWRGDGRELFYLTLDGTLMSVELDYGPTLLASPPRELIRHAVGTPSQFVTQYLVTHDGERFLISPRESAPALELVQGWLSTLDESR